jgi:general secretion pathway protein D
MNKTLVSATSLLLLVTTGVHAQPGANAEPPRPHEIDLYALIDRVADEVGKEIVYSRGAVAPLNSTAQGESDYETLKAALRTIEFMTVETADQILLLPEAEMRSAPTRVLQSDDRRVSDHEIITRVIDVPMLEIETPDGVIIGSAAPFVPILRPMLGRNGQLGAVQGTNKLIVVDRYDNVRRISAVIEEIVNDR